jgi:hypothetical protein
MSVTMKKGTAYWTLGVGEGVGVGLVGMGVGWRGSNAGATGKMY